MLNSATNLKASVDLKDGIQTVETSTFMYRGIASWNETYMDAEIVYWEGVSVTMVGGDIWKPSQITWTEMTDIYDASVAARLAFNSLCVDENLAFSDASSYISSYSYSSQVGGMTGSAAFAVDTITPGVR